MTQQVKISLFFLIFCVSYMTRVDIAYAFEINDIYIEGYGNNPFEAKIQAQTQGIKRAFLIYADKFAVRDEAVKISLVDINTSLISVSYSNEKLTSNSYGANSTYVFDRQILSTILYSNIASLRYQDNAFEALVIPVMKVGKLYHLYDSKIKWLTAWQDRETIMRDSHLLLVADTDAYATLLQTLNIKTLIYDTIKNFYPEFLIQNIYVIVAEFFTNLDSGSSYLQVEYRKLNPPTSNIIKKYDIPSSESFPVILDKIINDFINQYGIAVINDKAIINKTINLPLMKLKTLEINVETNNLVDWQKIKHKLDQVDCIKKIVILSQYDNEYKLQIKYEGDMESLATNLLKVGLTYINNKEVYHLIEYNKGI